MPEKETPTAFDRRKLLREMIPIAVGAYSSYRKVIGGLSPDRLIANMVRGRQAAAPQSLKKVSEEDLLAEIRGMDVKVLAKGIISLRLTMDQVFGFIEDRLHMAFAAEGGGDATLVRSGLEQATMALPSRRVSVRILPTLTQPTEDSIREAAILDSSETWVFTLAGSKEVDFPLEPLFLSESLVLFNHFRVAPLSSVLSGLFQKHFDVVITRRSGEHVIIMLNQK